MTFKINNKIKSATLLIIAVIAIVAVFFVTTDEDEQTFCEPDIQLYAAGAHAAINNTTVPDVNVELNDLPATGQGIVLIEEPLQFTEITYVELFDIDRSNDSINNISVAIASLNEAISSKEYTEEATEAMQAEVTRLQEIITYYESDIACYTTWEQEYYYSAKVWEYLKQRGYSDAAVAGIIGNMMMECGGCTMNLQPTIYNPTGNYYGICQWSRKYYPEIMDKPFEAQLDFLEKTIVGQFKTFGKRYRSGFTYEEFKHMTNPEEAALAFAKVYERCGSATYTRRQKYASKAFDYFVK